MRKTRVPRRPLIRGSLAVALCLVAWALAAGLHRAPSSARHQGLQPGGTEAPQVPGPPAPAVALNRPREMPAIARLPASPRPAPTRAPAAAKPRALLAPTFENLGEPSESSAPESPASDGAVTGVEPSPADTGPAPVPPREARAALARVGSDSEAERVWIQAINDPSRPAEERSDLIEDLNEDGFRDPHNVRRDELPLVEARLAIIDRLLPDAMDEVNAAAFREARKDLANMRLRLTGR